MNYLSLFLPPPPHVGMSLWFLRQNYDRFVVTPTVVLQESYVLSTIIFIKKSLKIPKG